jgi:hypothetical protein
VLALRRFAPHALRRTAGQRRDLNEKGKPMNTDAPHSFVANHSNALLAFGIVLVGFLAGLILGRAVARLIKSPAVGGFASRLCIIIGTLASLPLAYHFAIKAG